MSVLKSKNEFYSDNSDVEMIENIEEQALNSNNFPENENVPEVKAKKIPRKRSELQIERQLKKEKQEYEKTKKKIQQNEMKCMKPGECLKYMIVSLDENLLNMPCGTATVKLLDESSIKYESHQQAIPRMVTFLRTVVTNLEKEDNKFETIMKDVMQDQIVILIPTDDFQTMVISFNSKSTSSHGKRNENINLEDFISNCYAISGSNYYFTFVVQNWEAYNKKAGKKSINNLVIDEVLLNVQLKFNAHIKFIDSDLDFARLIFNFTKAIAECPYKRSRHEYFNNLNTYIDPKKGSLKIGTDGSGIEHTWRLMLMSFKNVSADIANAIVQHYPCPKSLIQAYKSCTNEKECLNLVENIVIRRGAGLTSTTRKVGPELSRRLYTFLTSKDPNAIIN